MTVPLSVLITPCLHHDIVLQVPLLFALTFVLATAAFRCTNLHGQYIACGLSGPVDALDLVSAFVDLTSFAGRVGRLLFVNFLCTAT